MSDEATSLHLVKTDGEATEPSLPVPAEGQARSIALQDEPGQHEHFVHFYEKEAQLYDAVAHFSAAGLAAGEPVILIATPAHRAMLLRRLKRSGCGVENTVASGQLIMLDARQTLSKFLVGQELDWDKFSALIGGVIAQSLEGRRPMRVRCYGEMVDLLWRGGNKQAAIRLEEMWNDLSRSHSFSLLCSYRMGNFYKAGDRALFDQACEQHTSIIPAGSTLFLEQRARSLENEIEHRKQLETALREALSQRAGVRVETSEAHRLVEETSELREERFRLLIESVQDYAIFLLDPEGRVSSWNTGAERIKGYRVEEIIGQHFSRFYPEEDVRAGKCERELEIAGKEGRFEDEGWRVRKDGSRFWANVVISRMVNRAGKLIGFAKVTRDLTQRRALEEERLARAMAEAHSTRLAYEGERLERALADQKSADELRDQLLGVVGHDLRSPLSSIAMASALMLKKGNLQEAEAKTVARIARSADRMSKIISQLLDFTRSRLGGGIPIDLRPIDFAEVCAEVIAEYETVHPNCVLRFQSDLDTKGVWDPAKLAQVVGNLVGNAIQHGKSHGSIDVALRSEGDAVCLMVHNEGEPIRADVLPSIFDPFRRGTTSTTRKTEGLGLGLFIVREMVRAHAGEIRVQSSEGEGTTFIVKLPRKPPVL
jgi:PAS domain S-box-containing protein